MLANPVAAPPRHRPGGERGQERDQQPWSAQVPDLRPQADLIALEQAGRDSEQGREEQPRQDPLANDHSASVQPRWSRKRDRSVHAESPGGRRDGCIPAAADQDCG